MKIKFPDGKVTEFPPGTTGLNIAESISRGLAAKALICRFNGILTDLSLPLPGDGEIEILTFFDQAGKEALRHSASHVLAASVKKLFPRTRLGIGPAIEDGFYYDMDIPDFPGSEALEKIELEIKKQISENIPFRRQEMSLEKARKLFRENRETYKLELLEDLKESGEKISIYSHGEFSDLCRGPHVPSTGYLKHMKILSIAGAYWRGNEKNPMLTRIYGTAFDSSSALKDHLELLEEAKRRDHRKLGRELELFIIGGDAGPGLVYWLPSGTVIKEELENLWKKAHRVAGYELVSTPHIAPAELWKISGHYDYYRDSMYFLDIDNNEYALKPMNCPGHIIIYKSRKRSYRDLPLRLAELGTVYRQEKSGVLHGLMRVRGFTVDDGHIFCSEDQLVDEIKGVVKFALWFLQIFNFGYEIEVSLRDPDDTDHYAGDPEEWKKAEPALSRALDELGKSYTIVTGEAAFYGPKIDIKLKDALGRLWQGPTIQFDFNIPNRFNLDYVGSDGTDQRVFLVHRALFGSVERFIGNLIEHYAGNMPGWLAPVQVVILPITSDQVESAEKALENLENAGLRCHLDERNETIGRRIRDAEKRKVPFMVLIGRREEELGQLALRKHGEGDLGSRPHEEVVNIIIAACRQPALPGKAGFYQK